MNISKSLFLVIHLIFCGVILNAQELHMPDEVEQYMKKSSNQYKIDSLSVRIDSIALPLIENGYAIAKNEDKDNLQKQPSELPRKARKYHRKALKFKKKKNYPKTIKFYKKALQVVPNHSQLINELAKVYDENDAIEEVIYWTKKSIEMNPIDFEAYARLAIAYQKNGNHEKALECIIKSHLYNRNHRGVIESMKNIFANHGMAYHDFTFQPKYKIENQGPKKISIQANEIPWKSYAACKALWLNEENYRERMSHLANTTTSKIEQKECLLNALISYERMKEGKNAFPYFEVLGNALRNRMIDDFIFYEIDLRQNPKIIFSVSDEKILRIIRYLTTVRVNREVTSE